MEKKINRANGDVMARLIELGGRTTQDMGLGRIVGQIGMYFYLSEGECSLDDIVRDLGLSKAAVSIAARQLEGLGLLQRVWKKGDRKNYYRMVEHLGLALQDGLMTMVRGKIRSLSMELAHADDSLKNAGKATADSQTKYMKQKVNRARKACDRAQKVLESPLLKLLRR